MSRPLHSWIALKRKRKEIRRNVQALFWLIQGRGLGLALERDFGRPEGHEWSLESLHWIAFECDMACYRQFGKSATGASWIKGERYPIPVYPGARSKK